MLPAVVGVGGVTIVIILFVILRYNIRAKSVKAGVSVGEWDSKRSIDSKSIVFVIPKAAIYKGF